MTRVRLLNSEGVSDYSLRGSYRGSSPDGASRFDRLAFAAAHVVADPLADIDPWTEIAIDWDRTLAFRHHLWSHGFAVAESMDTAQRGTGLGWVEALELACRSAADARTVAGAKVAAGVGTDHLPIGSSLDEVRGGYALQAEAIEATGAQMIIMSSRALASTADGPDDYVQVYSELLEAAREPVILHWLGPMFDPALQGYWGSSNLRMAMTTCLDIIRAHAPKIDGLKISLLDAELEIEMRRALPAGVRMYTGDDFNFPELIAGDEQGHSDALLGIFAAIAPVASAALAAHAAGDRLGYDDLLAPTIPLSRHIFCAPTRFYKSGIVFMAYLNGHQDHFAMVGGQQSARSAMHLSEVVRLADAAGLFSDPEQAAYRARAVLAPMGVV